MRGEPEHMPELLREVEYPFIGSRLLRDVAEDAYGRRPHTSVCLVEQGQPLPPIDENYHVTAMKRQLNQVLLWPNTLHPYEQFHQPADAFMAATADSIPLFDVVRGFYTTRPTAEQRRKLDYLPDLDHYTTPDRTRLLGKHVCIISHHLDYADKPVREAAERLYKDGAGQVSAIRTHAYEQAIDNDIDYERLSSAHRAWLHRIGELCVWQP